MNPKRYVAAGLTIACAAAIAVHPAEAALLDANFTEEPYAQAGNRVTSMAWAPDGSRRLFVTRHHGEVRIVQDGELVTTPFWEFSPIYAQSECGLLGVAFDPLFEENRWVYFFVTVSATEQQIIRLTADGNVGADPVVIVSGLPTAGDTHNGGALGFGPDGKLYWAIGDQGTRIGTDDDLSLLAAKVGRANRDGTTPEDNPFFDGDGPNNDLIWARGFRNPFTFTWQPATDNLWVNVVGSAFEQILEIQAGDHGGWSTYEGNQPAGFVSPKVLYRTDRAWERTLAATNGAVRVNGVTTFTTTAQLWMSPGMPVTIAGTTDASFEGTGYVASVVSATQFTMLQSGPDATSGGGTATNPHFGGCVNGGTFLDSTSSEEYEGNFFFGDYNSGRLGRVILDSANTVRRFEVFGEEFLRPIDFSTGPDGDLYLVTYNGVITRFRHRATAQGIVLSNLHARLMEGGSFALGVRLATPPSGPVVVRAARGGGDTDVAASSAELTFDAQSWDEPQTVRITAAQDSDSVDDVATVILRSTGLTNRISTVRVTDDDVLALLTSTTALSIEEGDTQTFGVSLSGPPAAPTVVHAAFESGDPDITLVGQPALEFDPSNWSVPQLVQVAAALDMDVTDDTATLVLSADGFSDRTIAITALDSDESPPSFVTAPITTAVVDSMYEYDADATGRPEPEYALVEAPLGMMVDPDSGLVSWTPMATGVYEIVIEASNGLDPAAVQAFELEVIEDQAPTCMLDQPRPGDVISGTDAEFYGDVEDDVGVARGQFFIDGELAYTDENATGHFHFGGEHNSFDTTALSDGPHTLELVGDDSSGQRCSSEVSITVANDSGGAAGAGGTGSGGDSASGGSGAGAPPSEEAGAPGRAGAGGDGASSDEPREDDAGCGCRTPQPTAGSGWIFALALGAVFRFRRRRFIL